MHAAQKAHNPETSFMKTLEDGGSNDNEPTVSVTLIADFFAD